MAIALLTGFRLGDILALEWRDIDWERGFITITTRKTQMKIVMPIHPRLYEWLTQAKKSTGTIVEDPSHRRWSAYVGARTLALSGARYTPHVLRHTFASNIKDDIRRQRLLGHTSLATTKIYTHFSLEEYEQEVGGLYR